MKSIYLDYCTTTPVAASVREAMAPYFSEFYGHPGGAHWFCRASQEAIEDARSSVASLLDCHPTEIVFTAGGTESVNLALLGAARAIRKEDPELRPHLISSKLEHSCVLNCIRQLQKEGWDVTLVGCDENGTICPDEIDDAIRAETRLVTIGLASARLGTLQPVCEVAELCENHNIVLHTDACQAIGKADCGVQRLGADLLSLSGHKFYAPKGIGALYVRSGVSVEPIMFGEGCESGIRPGTANVPFIVGLGQAAKLALGGIASTIDQTEQIRDSFLARLELELGRKLKVHSAEADRLPNVLCFELPGVCAEALQLRLPELCLGSMAYPRNTESLSLDPAAGEANEDSLSSNRSHAAMGLKASQSASTVRVSIGWNTSREELTQAAQMIAAAYEVLSEKG